MKVINLVRVLGASLFLSAFLLPAPASAHYYYQMHYPGYTHYFFHTYYPNYMEYYNHAYYPTYTHTYHSYYPNYPGYVYPDEMYYHGLNVHTFVHPYTTGTYYY